MAISGIYKITNQINNKSYIGKSKDIMRRWRQHKTEPYNINADTYDVAFYRAIRKYGIENFQFEIIEQCPEDQLNEREKYWIEYYNTYMNHPNAQGYNMTRGGEYTYSEPQYDYDYILELWNQGKTHQEILNIVRCADGTLIYILDTLQIPVCKRRYRGNLYKANPVNQYDLEGHFINSYSSISEAARNLLDKYPAANVSNICYACNGKIISAYGYLWRYKNSQNTNNDLSKIEISIAKQKSTINQYDLEGKYIATYPTIKDALLENHLSISQSAIANACNGSTKSSGGFMWRYYNDVKSIEDLPMPWSKKEIFGTDTWHSARPVIQYDLEGNFIQEYPSCAAAAKAVGMSQPSGISRACSGTRKTAKGFLWKYKYENEQQEVHKNG